MEELDVTWTRALRVWWSLIWRMAFYSTIAGALVGAIVGLSVGLLGDPANIRFYGQIAGYLISAPVGIWVVRTILTKQYRSFRIALLPSQESLLEAAVEGKTS